jgi:hypothetical protein
MSGAADNIHLQGGPRNTFQDVADTGHAQIESSYDQVVTPPRIQFPATSNTAMQLENIPCSVVVISNPIGNNPICVGGVGDQAPYIDRDYIGDFRGTLLYEGMSKPWRVKNANRLSVVGTPLESFSYECHVNVLYKIITSNESPPNPDTIGPTVLSTDPSDESENQPLDRTVTITMNEPILASSINLDNLTIAPAVSYDVFPDPLSNRRIKLSPLVNLQYGTEYTVTLVAEGLKDLSENVIAEDYMFQFTTIPSPPPPPPPDSTAPTVQATNPIDTATSVPRDKIVTITMDEPMLASSINTSNITIDPSIDYDVFLNPVNTSQIVLNHSVLFTYNTLYTITINAGGIKDVAGNGIASQFVFDFTIEVQPTIPDTTPPTVTAIDPTNGATGVVRDKTITITFSETIVESSITTSNILFAGGAAIGYAVFRDAVDNTKIKLDPDGTLDASTLYTITLIAGGVKDLSENGIASQLQFTFTTQAAAPDPDTTSPTITARSPAPSATGVSISTDVVVDFSEPLDPASVTTDTFELMAPGPVEVAAVVSLENGNTRVRLNPNSNLATSASHTMFVRTGVTDVAANNLAVESSWSFTTEAAPPPADTTPPTITARTPVSGATNVLTTTTIIIDFDESLDANTVHNNSFELYNTAPNPDVEVTCSIGLSAISGQSNRRITMTPTTTLLSNTLYQVFVKTLVKDVAGNALASESSWFFTTTTALAIVARNPAASATSVAVSSDIIVDFNRALNTGTVTTSTFQLFNTSTGIQVTAGTLNFENGNTRVRFDPTSNLSNSTQYQVICKAAIADTIGTTLGSDSSAFFTTILQFNVTSRNPAPDAIDVPIGGSIVVDFNKAINPATVTSNTVELFDTSTNPDTEKSCTRQLSNGNTRLTITPNTTLAYSKLYEVFLRTGLKDTTGASLPSQVSWFFTTENNPVTITLIYNISGNGAWWSFGDTGGGSNDRHGRGLKIKSAASPPVENSISGVRVTEVKPTAIRRIGSMTGRDDTMRCVVRSSSGTLRTTIGTYAPVSNISTSSSGTQITFANPDNTYVCVVGDSILVEYDDGDDDHRFEMNQNSNNPAAYSVEAYTTSIGGSISESSSRDMGAIIYGQRS